MSKLLLYCTKNKWRLFFDKVKQVFTLGKVKSNNDLNGKIVAECDFEVEKIELLGDEINIFYGIENKACLTTEQIENYLGYDNDYKGYAIHIRNLNIFDEPRDLRDYYTNRIYTKIEDVYTDEIQIKGSEWVRPIKQAPQNMMYAYDNKEKKILISIKPEHLCKILNGEKTIEIRKKVLKEMLKNE